MKPRLERVRSLLLIPVLIASLLTGTGCSVLIASSGVSSVPGIATGSTRQEVRRTLGDPESSETRGDEALVETHRIRMKVKSAWKGMEGVSVGAVGPYGAIVAIPLAFLFEVYATGKAIYDSGKGVQTLAFVYGPDDRLLTSYDANVSPESRFIAESHPLNAVLWAQLENDKCPTWSACLTSHLDERRKRAAWVGYTLRSTDEESARHLLAVARDRDDGRMTKGEALIRSEGLFIVPDENVSSDGRFRTTRGTLDLALRTQLEQGGCPAWLPCSTSYVEELRRRAVVMGYTLSPTDEENSRHVVDVASARDEGRITTGEAHIGIARREGSQWSLDEALRSQLSADGCLSWVVCVSFHESERRRRAASGNSTITPEEENDMSQRLKIATDVDQGRMTKTDALQALRY